MNARNLALVVIAGFAFPLLKGPVLDAFQPSDAVAGVESEVTPRTREATPRRKGHIGHRTVRVQGDGRGHFNVRATINGRSAEVLVDTGASMIAISESAARRMGVRVGRDDWTGQASTANGIVKTADVTLRSVKVGSITVRNVRAAVLPDGALSTVLLGMTFLKKLKSFEIKDNTLTLKG